MGADRLAAAVGAALVVLLLAACTGQQSADRPSAGPTVAEPAPWEWLGTSPEEAGLDPDRLGGLYRDARRGRSHCVLVARDGRLVGERYFGGTGPETAHPVFSVTKSITSVLVGIAQDEGLLDVDQPAARWIPRWRGTPAAEVTVRDLLANVSGRAWSMQVDYAGLVGNRDQTTYAVRLPQSHAPGEVWAYNNSAIQALDAVLSSAVGEPVATFAEERLFGPLDMRDTDLARDASGNTTTYSGATSTCRDLGRFGLLMLQDGRWEGEEVVPESWVQESTGRSSSDLNAAYGLLWWVNRSGVLADPLSERRRSELGSSSVPRGRYVDGAPTDMFWAIGLGGQVVQVDPGSGTVVVRIGTPVLPGSPGGFGARDTARFLVDAVQAPG